MSDGFSEARDPSEKLSKNERENFKVSSACCSAEEKHSIGQFLLVLLNLIGGKLGGAVENI